MSSLKLKNFLFIVIVLLHLFYVQAANQRDSKDLNEKIMHISSIKYNSCNGDYNNSKEELNNLEEVIIMKETENLLSVGEEEEEDEELDQEEEAEIIRKCVGLQTQPSTASIDQIEAKGNDNEEAELEFKTDINEIGEDYLLYKNFDDVEIANNDRRKYCFRYGCTDEQKEKINNAINNPNDTKESLKIRIVF